MHPAETGLLIPSGKRRYRTTENDPRSTCSIIIEERVYLNIVTKFCRTRATFASTTAADSRA